MAVDLYDPDSLLLPPPESLFISEENRDNKPISQTSWSPSSSCFSSSDFGSALSSPLESEQTSIESESEQDDDYIAELTRQMAHYMLQDYENRHEKQAWTFAGSTEEEETMIGKFDNLKANEEKRLLGNVLEPISVPLTIPKPRTPNLEFQSKQALIDYQIRVIQLRKLRQEQIMKQKQKSLCLGKQANWFNNHIEHSSKTKAKQFHRSKRRFPNGQNVTWANLQQRKRSDSNMTAVFLGELGSRTVSSGTGVFLPKGIGNTCESRKKPGCSTVLARQE